MPTSNLRFIDGAIALAAVTALLYAVGTAEFGGYLSTLRLNENILDRNFHQVLYRGFIALYGPACMIAIIYLAGAFLYSHGILPVILDALRDKTKTGEYFLKMRVALLGERKDSPIEKRAKRYTVQACIVFVFLLSLLIALYKFEQSGVEDARQAIARLESGNYQASELINISIDGAVKRLFFLVCGSSHCAAVDPATSEIIYFPHQIFSYSLALTKEQPIKKSNSAVPSGE